MRSISVVRLIFGAALIASVTAICITLYPPRDLKLMSVKVVTAADPQFVKDATFGRWEANDRFARVEFSTSQNLARWGHNQLSIDLLGRLYLCSNIGENGKEDFPPLTIYDEYGEVGPAYSDKPQHMVGHHSYHAYIPLRQQRFRMLDLGEYDLVVAPQDVCFVVEPFNQWIGRFWPSSNEVRVSHKILTDRIQNFQR